MATKRHLAPDLKLSLRMRHELDRSYTAFDKVLKKTLKTGDLAPAVKKALRLRFKVLGEAVEGLAYGGNNDKT